MQSKYKKVAVIMGGNSAERDVSILSGNAVLASLQRSGVNAYKFDPSEDSICKLVQNEFDCAVIMLHGRGGEDGTIQGVLDYMRIPYSGSSVTASAIALNKHITKLIWQNVGIPMPKWNVITNSEYNKEMFKFDINLPVVVKPVKEGSTFGLTKVYELANLHDAISLAFKYDDEVLIEELIVGAEFTAPVFNNRVYPLVKIEAPNGEYDYQNKYFTDNTKYICPYDLGDELNEKVKKFALLSYQSIDASGVARVDFMLNDKNELFFLEINTIPGMTSHSLVPMSFKASGCSFDDLCLKILDDAKLKAS
ncbi:MAG: D-alanine--D-alanine ligase [Neisseriaceae bacterium]